MIEYAERLLQAFVMGIGFALGVTGIEIVKGLLKRRAEKNEINREFEDRAVMLSNSLSDSHKGFMNIPIGFSQVAKLGHNR